MTHLRSALVSAALALTLVLTASAGPASAFRFYNTASNSAVEWYVSNIRWCINENNYWTTTLFPSTITTAFEKWDTDMTKRTISRYTAGPNCEVEIHVVSFSAKGWPNAPARATMVPTAEGYIYDGDLYFNADRTSEFWFSTAHHYCTVPCSDRPLDLFTIALHEFGHTIGIGHNQSTLICQDGGDTEQGWLFCPDQYYTLDPMYFAAADGYRRWITEDSRRALIALHYR
jgi:hypothetical protein